MMHYDPSVECVKENNKYKKEEAIYKSPYEYIQKKLGA